MPYTVSWGEDEREKSSSLFVIAPSGNDGVLIRLGVRAEWPYSNKLFSQSLLRR